MEYVPWFSFTYALPYGRQVKVNSMPSFPFPPSLINTLGRSGFWGLGSRSNPVFVDLVLVCSGLAALNVFLIILMSSIFGGIFIPY